MRTTSGHKMDARRARREKTKKGGTRRKKERVRTDTTTAGPRGGAPAFAVCSRGGTSPYGQVWSISISLGYSLSLGNVHPISSSRVGSGKGEDLAEQGAVVRELSKKGSASI